MNNSQQTKEPQDQLLFTVDAETFRQFCELLNAPVKYNPGLGLAASSTPRNANLSTCAKSEMDIRVDELTRSATCLLFF